MAENPWDRDLRHYSIGGAVLLVLFIATLVAGGLVLKQHKKHPTKPVMYGGCYVWSDGVEQCQRRV